MARVHLVVLTSTEYRITVPEHTCLQEAGYKPTGWTPSLAHKAKRKTKNADEPKAKSRIRVDVP